MASSGATVLVGIDVGMTCTGVSFAIKNEQMEMVDPHVIQTWEGNDSAESDKVPTAIAYHPNGHISWGFLTRSENEQDEQDEQDNPKVEFHEWFKTFFDENEYNKARRVRRNIPYLPPSHSDVKRYYKDFLSKLYPEIKKHLRDSVRTWATDRIEFLFSVPTTWTKLGLSPEFKRLAISAGFGQDSPNHKVEVYLTEAEAAAVHTFNTQNTLYDNDDVLLIVDAGGGTTDVALLKVEKSQGNRPSLRELDEVRGDEIGSVEIDLAFADLAETKLRPLAHELGIEPGQIKRVATKMGRNFKICKEQFGTEISMGQPDKRIRIPVISEAVTLASQEVVRGKMVFKNAEIQALFDDQLKKMYRLIDYQLDRMIKVAPSDRVSHLVLSGGLGSSQYVKKRLIERYTKDRIHSHAPHLLVISSTRPQLAVVKGLVQDRMQQLKLNKPTLRSRICRQSIGIICLQPYNANRPGHQQAQLHRDPIDNLMYAKDQVVWLIEQGQVIERDFVEHTFYRTFLEKESRQWESSIAFCNSRLKPLPLVLREGNLNDVPLSRFEKKKKRWWQFWKKYRTHYKASYTIRFLLKPASIDSELWFQNQKYSKDNNFAVTWDEGANIAAPREYRSPSPDRHI